jgi:uncharacterized protein (DUF2252 family)
MSTPTENATAPTSLAQRRRAAKSLRTSLPRASQGLWQPPPDRPDPVELLRAQDADRLSDLVPLRYQRMLSSPFAFLRGAAAVMAHDLGSTPTTGLYVQLCGDAHLSNFGVFATPERKLIFDLTDFDETVIGPWEWDVKRLATSVVVAARVIGAGPAASAEAAMTALCTYRQRMGEYATMDELDVWYARVAAPQWLRNVANPNKRVAKQLLKRAANHNRITALSRLTHMVDGELRFVLEPPKVLPLEEATERMTAERALRGYRDTLLDSSRRLLARYQLADVARNTVGVGSIGTRCYLALLEERGGGSTPLILQFKEAVRPVLSPFVPRSPYRSDGRRVVAGQHQMQAASDIFLGWMTDEDGRSYYGRQLWDMKGGPDPETMRLADLPFYADLCGWTLARAHARSSDQRVEIAAYLGTSDRFDRAAAAFAEEYADQTERDYEVLLAAVKAGRVPADPGA